MGGAGHVFDPENATHNAGFIRDEGAVLLIVIITNEADHTHIAYDVDQLEAWILDAKAGCGGANCIISAALLSDRCIGGGLDNNLSFLSRFGEVPIWVSIDAYSEYTSIFGDALAQVVGETCEEIVVVK